MAHSIYYLAGDIGGTNSRLHLMSHDSYGQELLVAKGVYPSKKYDHLTQIIELFLRENLADKKIDAWPRVCCLAVAGPVEKNIANITNLSWVLNGAQMSKTLGIPTVRIVNDFVGIGYGLLALTPEDVFVINDVPAKEEAPKACIGAGTGLGTTYLTHNGKDYDVWAGEGGHSDFGAQTADEHGLSQYIMRTKQIDHVSVERVVSGSGLPSIYDYFCAKEPGKISPRIIQQMQTKDRSYVIAKAAEAGTDELCTKAIDLFVNAYGAEAGNMALKTIPKGGMYIAGGVAPKLMWAIQKNDNFKKGFLRKGRMTPLLQTIPVYIVLHPQVGLLGAKVLCRRALRNQGYGFFKPGSPSVNSSLPSKL